jgi:hypothetical protein
MYSHYFEKKYGVKFGQGADPHVILAKRKGDPEIYEIDLLPSYPDVFSKLVEFAESK